MSLMMTKLPHQMYVARLSGTCVGAVSLRLNLRQMHLTEYGDGANAITPSMVMGQMHLTEYGDGANAPHRVW
jgi:hypothetical protein